MKNRIKKIIDRYLWYVFVENDVVIGYAYASEWKVRCAYKYTVESSIYIRNDCQGKGTDRARI